jgi:hypothetical protein
MWEDIVYGLEQLGNSEDYITFLGSVITMHDIKHESIAPIVRGETPLFCGYPIIACSIFWKNSFPSLGLTVLSLCRALNIICR